MTGQDLARLTQTVQSYTQQVIAAFAGQGMPVDMVSIGNEIRNGILWPVGQMDPSTGAGYDALATLLKAGMAGVRAANPRGHRLAQVPEGLGAGLFCWEPERIPGVGWESGAGTPNDNLTLFDF